MLEINKKKPKTKKLIDLKNKKFKHFRVIKYSRIDHNHCRVWLCECKCNKEFEQTTKYILKYNKTLSCGCMKFKNKHHNQKYSPKEAAWRARITSYRCAAKWRKIEWKLTVEDAIKIIKQNCLYCGEKPKSRFNLGEYKKNAYKNISSKNYTIFHNGIDRLNSKKGYIKGNCVTCCKICNFAKHTMSYNQFIKWIKKVKNHLKI